MPFISAKSNTICVVPFTEMLPFDTSHNYTIEFVIEQTSWFGISD